MRKPRNQASAAKTETRPRDPAEYLEAPEDVVAYLEAAFEDGDSRLIAGAIGDIARSKGMTKVAAEAGLGRESLYKALSPEGNPGLTTVLKVLKVLGVRLHPIVTGPSPTTRADVEAS